VLSFSKETFSEEKFHPRGGRAPPSAGRHPGGGLLGLLGRIFGVGMTINKKNNTLGVTRPRLDEVGKEAHTLRVSGGTARGLGLEPDLSSVKLERYPFVSIHLPLYNEKRVVDRLLKACSQIDYPHFEIVVIDDSTDETTKIVQRFANRWNKTRDRDRDRAKEKDNQLKSPRPRLGSAEGGQISISRPLIKVIHRKSRSGFKGGALREALRASHPQTEFVVVLDADFIPYPDTLEMFLKYFQVSAGGLDFKKETKETYETKEDSKIAVVGGYQWHVLNKSENWITRGVRTEYSGSYVVERAGREILGLLKQISGSVYMIRADVLRSIGWETSITEDFQLTLKLYEQGYKVVYTPYIQAPAECVSTLKRLIKQRMRWAEGHSNNIRRMFTRLMWGRWQTQPLPVKTVGIRNQELGIRNENKTNQNPNSSFIIHDSKKKHERQKTWVSSPLTLPEKLELLYISPYYLQAAFFLLGTFAWLLSELVFRTHLPFWASLWGWSLVLTNLLSLPLMNAVGLFLEEAEEKDWPVSRPRDSLKLICRKFWLIKRSRSEQPRLK
jgi:cellulose synthase/poly-beta-1,6-N-acetylglucosamine synthase-like glycosyltransferase